MKNISATQLGLLLLAAAVIGGVYYFLQQQKEPARNTEESSEVFNIVGEVQSVGSSSFVVRQEGRDFTVEAGDQTSMIRLSLPSTSEEGSFIPEQKKITLQDIKIKDQVFVRSSHQVKQGEDIVNPLEVQVLP